ncbi:CBS domain-containing protein [Desulfosarcina ovata]|uniref:Inosine-5-monophosphate dehydrogenase n=2 Tax=Desulfosarcina ovata TaxID=83564 RepID=A0A5K8AIJ5_9BACT|nr:CBS domain-containing protein [Desulfosarcina ovata]BBO85403.1 inosine-5-monophosphate dehydrogenase [Desulfosarcina ovata subsp. sediminis]BBO92306.1 inosine-5-monophosphate dehydrogenase [Desulfosarcina ovata subsp. ovata]
MRVQDVMKQKRRKVHTIPVERTAEDAIVQMTESGTSALIVMGGDRPVGIFTERDVLRCHVAWRGRLFREMPLREAMTHKLIVAQPDDLVSSAMAMMIKADIRHLPVVEDQCINGMLAISDLVKHHVGELTAELHYLQEYITDLQDAVQD